MNTKTSLKLALGTTMAAGIALGTTQAFAENPFSAEKLSSGYLQLAENKSSDMKCGAGMCGGNAKKAATEGEECPADTDKDGKVVRSIDIGGLKAGVHTFTWDGTMTDGTDAPSGSYNVSIAASNGGTQLVAQPLQFALVQGVIRSNGGNTLDLGTYGTTTLDEVRQII